MQGGMSAAIAAAMAPSQPSAGNKPGLKADNKKSESSPHKQATPNTAAHKAEANASNSNDDAVDHSAAPAENGNRRPYRPSPMAIAYEKKMAEIDERINGIKRRMAALRGDPASSSGDPNASAAVKAEREHLVSKLRDVHDEQKKTIEQRRAVAKEFAGVRELLHKKSTEISSQKDKLPFKNPVEIDRLVAEYEHQLETNAFKLSEERQILQEISKLRKAKRELKSIDGSGSEVGNLKLRLDVLRGKLQECDDSLDTLRAHQESFSEELRKLDGIRSGQQAKSADRQKQIEALKRELDAEYDKRRTAYAENKDARRAQQAVALKAQARREEMRHRQEIEDKIDELEGKLSRLTGNSDVDRHWNECTNLSAFFSAYLPKPEIACAPEASANKAARQPDAHNDDFVALKPKSERDEEFTFMGIKAKKLAKPKKEPANAPPMPGKPDLSRLPMPILVALADMSLVPPSDIADVEKLLKTLDARKASLESGRAASQAALADKQQAILMDIDALKAKLEEPAKVNVAAMRRKEAAAAEEQEEEVVEK